MGLFIFPLGDGEEKATEPPVRQHVKEQEQYQENKDLSSSWKPNSEGKDAEDSKKVKEFGEPQDHSKETKEPTKTIWKEEESFKPKESEPPFYQEVITKNEKPTKHFQVETKGPIVSVEKVTEKQTEIQPTEQEDLDDADAELERKLEELTPSNNHPAEPAVKDKPTQATTTFHHWRQFVDNNPNFPYTIPVKVDHEELPKKPTTEKWREPITERKTTKKTTTIKQQVRTEPPKMTEKAKATEKVTAHKDNAHGMEFGQQIQCSFNVYFHASLFLCIPPCYFLSLNYWRN